MLVVLKCPKVTIHLSRCDDNNLQIIITETSSPLRCRNIWNFAQGSKFKADFYLTMSVCRHKLGFGGSTPPPSNSNPGRHLAHRPHTLIWFPLPPVPWPLPPRCPQLQIPGAAHVAVWWPVEFAVPSPNFTSFWPPSIPIPCYFLTTHVHSGFSLI